MTCNANFSRVAACSNRGSNEVTLSSLACADAAAETGAEEAAMASFLSFFLGLPPSPAAAAAPTAARAPTSESSMTPPLIGSGLAGVAVPQQLFENAKQYCKVNYG